MKINVYKHWEKRYNDYINNELGEKQMQKPDCNFKDDENIFKILKKAKLAIREWYLYNPLEAEKLCGEMIQEVLTAKADGKSLEVIRKYVNQV